MVEKLEPGTPHPPNKNPGYALESVDPGGHLQTTVLQKADDDDGDDNNSAAAVGAETT